MYKNIKNENIYLDDRMTDNERFHLAMAGITLPDPTYLILHMDKGNHLWKYYNFEYVVSGKGYIKTKNKTYVVNSGDLFFLNKNRNHTYYSDKKTPYQKLFISVEGSYIDSLIQLHNITNSVIIVKANAQPIFERIFSITEQCNGHNFSAETYTELSCALLNLIQKISPPDFSSHNLTTQQNSAAVLKTYIDDNIYEKIQITNLCVFMNLSETHVQRIFKKTYGTTIANYIRNQKLNIAKHLLSTTFLNVSEIANKLSYENPKCFATLFKKHFGITPSDYAKQSREGQNKQK